MIRSAANQAPSLSELHLLLTYECNYKCDHCFVWGGPSQGGTMTVAIIEHILDEAERLDSIEWIYFEGGEPFLYHELLHRGVRMARQRGFRVGIVSNASWVTSETEATNILRDFAGEIEDLSISDDGYHGGDNASREALIAHSVAEKLGIPVDFISIDIPAVRYRGRAAEKLAPFAHAKPWEQFNECPWEDLQHPQRVHVDAYGNLHICQGISIGNLVEQPLSRIMRQYNPEAHPIVGPLITGGPAEVVNRYELLHQPVYADACHLCYLSRCKLRDKFKDVLTPDQMYGSD